MVRNGHKTSLTELSVWRFISSMSNERNTENLTRKILTNLGYYSNNQILVEEQKSQNGIISSLLSKASKSGGGAGYPEFIITHKNSDVVIIIECKANPKDHESPTKDKVNKCAVDGALHYASFLKADYNIIAIGISGENEEELKISTFQWNKNEKRYLSKKFLSMQEYSGYFDIFHSNDKIILTEDELMSYAKKLHDQMRDEVKLKEAEKPLLVAALLLALDNDEFVREYKTIINPKKLASRIIESITDSLEISSIPKVKIDTLKNEFGFITTHTYLTSGEIDPMNPSHSNNSLHKFLVDVQNKVYPFVKKVNNIDVIGKFYSEFLRYTGGDGKGLGIVLTPTHITDLFCDLAEVNKNSKVLDLCTGTGAFLISAMEKMLSDDPTVAEINSIYQNSLVGCETQTNMFALACANMIIRGDGKTNLFQSNCFDISTEQLQSYGCNVGMINPPYSQKKEEEKELVFINKLCNSLTVGGLCIAIIPQSVVMSNLSNDSLKTELLKKHTLKAVMSMPDELFYPAGTVTCIVVFEAHRPHSENKKSWFGYWKNDGFEKIRNQGRVDFDGKFKNTIKLFWLDSYRYTKEIEGYSVLKNVNGWDEWLVEAYMQTDYLKLTNNYFEKNLKEYSTYKFYNELSELVSNKPLSKIEFDLDITNWHYFSLEDIFEITGSKTTPKKEVQESGIGKYPYITTSTMNNGVEGFYDYKTDIGNILTIDSAVKGFCSYQAEDFSASDHVEKLIPKFEMNTYTALFLQTLINMEQFRYSYGRKFNQIRIRNTKIKLPISSKGEPDWQFMEDYIKSLPYSSSV